MKEKQTAVTSRGNFLEKIYPINTIQKSKSREIDRIVCKSSGVESSFLKNHPAYFTDLLAFQHIEIWFPALTLKNNELIVSNSPRKTPLILTCRIGSNNQKLLKFNLRLGGLNYKITDFETKEKASLDRIFFTKDGPKALPYLFNDGRKHNGAFLDNLLISTKDNFLGQNLFELNIEDKNLSARMLFRTEWSNFENSFAEILKSDDSNYPVRNFASKRWLKFIHAESFLKYNNKIINIPKSPQVTAYVDESYGFPQNKKNWDWLIFKGNSYGRKKDIRLMVGKNCLRGGYEKKETNKLATLFIDGKIYRLKGSVIFDYDINNLLSPWQVHFFDPTQPNKYNIKIITDYIAPTIESSLINESFGLMNLTLDLKRIIAKASMQIILNGKKIKSQGIGSFESNKGVTRNTKYFND